MIVSSQLAGWQKCTNINERHGMVGTLGTPADLGAFRESQIFFLKMWETFGPFHLILENYVLGIGEYGLRRRIGTKGERRQCRKRKTGKRREK